MGYASISNLYADTRILEQAECFCLEKIHGTSAHVSYTPASTETGAAHLHFHSGEQQANFEAFFADKIPHLLNVFGFLGVPVKVHGECYGGKIQQNSWRYGKDLRFTAFDVLYDGKWLSVPDAEKVVELLGLEFVHYIRIPTQLSLIDAARDATSEQAIRNGVTTRNGEFVRREGVVLRPIEEKPDHRGNRICDKHKRAEERETKTIRPVNADKIALSKAARDVAEEWVTENRIKNAQSHFSESEWVLTNMRSLIRYVYEDVLKEAGSEVENTPANCKEINSRAAQLIKQNFASTLASKENQ